MHFHPGVITISADLAGGRDTSCEISPQRRLAGVRMLLFAPRKATGARVSFRVQVKLLSFSRGK